MPERLLVLVAGGDPRLAEAVRRCVAPCRRPVAVQWLRDGALALARLGGGDVDALLIDPASEGIGDLLEVLRAACPRDRTIVVSESQSESQDWSAELRQVVETRPRQPDSPGAPRRGPKRIGFLGAKGGVGTTTVALNAASALARTHATLLVELGSGNDTLKLHVRTTARSLSPPGAALNCLWSVKDISRLRVALTQDLVDSDKVCGELEAAGESEYLVLDLGSTLTPAVIGALPGIDALGVVVDLEMLSAECARRVLSTLGQPDLCPRGSIGMVVVNRASLACPFSVDEMQRLVGVPVLGTIPSAGDLCSSAQKARRPVVAFDAESLAAQSLVQVAFSLAELA